MQNMAILCALMTGTTEAASSEVQPMTRARLGVEANIWLTAGHRVRRVAPGVHALAGQRVPEHAAGLVDGRWSRRSRTPGTSGRGRRRRR